MFPLDMYLPRFTTTKMDVTYGGAHKCAQDNERDSGIMTTSLPTMVNVPLISSICISVRWQCMRVDHTWEDALALATAEGMCEICVNGHRTR